MSLTITCRAPMQNELGWFIRLEQYCFDKRMNMNITEFGDKVAITFIGTEEKLADLKAHFEGLEYEQN